MTRYCEEDQGAEWKTSRWAATDQHKPKKRSPSDRSPSEIVKFSERENGSNTTQSERDCTIWWRIDMTFFPSKNDRFDLTRREFFDSLFLRCGWTPRRLPCEYVWSGKSHYTFMIWLSWYTDHALICNVRWFVTLRHNELHDLTADILSTVCKDVCKETALHNCNADENRADVSARGLTTYAKSICWCKNFLSVRSKLSKPGPLCHFPVNGASKKEEVQFENHGKRTRYVHTAYILNKWWYGSRGKSVFKLVYWNWSPTNTIIPFPKQWLG